MPSARLPRVLRSKGNLAKALVPILGLFFLFRFLTFRSEPQSVPIYKYENTSLPPLYPALRDRERKLPQHRIDLPFPEGKNGMW
jgi:hypothetical protein